jgi:hypothetical protein
MAAPTSVRPETASFGPGRRFHFFVNLNVAKLRLGLQKRSSLALNQNLPFLNEHCFVNNIERHLSAPGLPDSIGII